MSVRSLCCGKCCIHCFKSWCCQICHLSQHCASWWKQMQHWRLAFYVYLNKMSGWTGLYHVVSSLRISGNHDWATPSEHLLHPTASRNAFWNQPKGYTGSKNACKCAAKPHNCNVPAPKRFSMHIILGPELPDRWDSKFLECIAYSLDPARFLWKSKIPYVNTTT